MPETISVMGLTLHRTPVSAVSPASKHCSYLDRGFCTVCDCDRCEGGLLTDEWRAANRAGDFTAPVRECACVRRARNRKHLRDSGMEELVSRCTFSNFMAHAPWQQEMKRRATDYVAHGENSSFFIGGQSGGGKTHICAAIAGELLRRGCVLRYFLWVEDGRHLKQLVGEREEYERELNMWKSVPVLCIDDLFKQEITDADLSLLYMILNHRYNNRLPTIISSERSLEQIRRVRNGEGEALAGRIYEMCGRGAYCLEISGKEKNYRFFPEEPGAADSGTGGQWTGGDGHGEGIPAQGRRG